MNTIEDISKYACSGCGACAAVCRPGAIALAINPCGFYQAGIDEAKCVNCGKCRSVCMRYEEHTDAVNLHDAKLYALQSSDREVLLGSASGGIAHELSRLAIEDKIKAVGVCYNYEENIAEHIIIDDLRDLYKLDGSKYLQSNAAPAFREVLKAAAEDKENRFIVFGLPCQIYGLKMASEMAGVSDQIVLVELFCHGVPSYRLWEKELERIGKKTGTRHFKKLTFRDKNTDWHNYCITADAEDKTFRGIRERDLFWQAYFEDILLGEACYQCRFRKEQSFADIRIGDYWGSKYQFNREGVSAVYACTAKGEAAVRHLLDSKRVRRLKATSAQEMLSMQNMSGYESKQSMHSEGLERLKAGEDVVSVIRGYRRRMPAGSRIKRMLMYAGSILPERVRIRLRKHISLILMRKGK